MSKSMSTFNSNILLHFIFKACFMIYDVNIQQNTAFCRNLIQVINDIAWENDQNKKYAFVLLKSNQ